MRHTHPEFVIAATTQGAQVFRHGVASTAPAPAGWR